MLGACQDVQSERSRRRQRGHMKPWLDEFLTVLEPDAYEEHGQDVAFEQDPGLHGLIRPSATGKGLRLAYFVSEPAERVSLQTWASALPAPRVGKLRIVDAPDGSRVQLSGLVSYGDGMPAALRRLRSVARAHHALAAAPRERLPLLETLHHAGLMAPPYGSAATEPPTLGLWFWGTEVVDRSRIYNSGPEFVTDAGLLDRPTFVLCHSGHGMQSWYLSLVVTSGPVTVFTKHAFGQAYTDIVQDRLQIAATYARLHALFAGIPTQDGPVRWLLTKGHEDPQLFEVRHAGASARLEHPRRYENESAAFADLAQRVGWSHHVAPSW